MTPSSRDAQILDLWRDGLTGPAIAARLGLTRNAVMGVVHRAQKAGLLKAPPRREAPQSDAPRKEQLTIRLDEPVLAHLRTMAAAGRWSGVGPMIASMLAEIVRDDAAAEGRTAA